MTQKKRRRYLVERLLREKKVYNPAIPIKAEEQETLLRALMNIRMPNPIDHSFLEIQDEYLQLEIKKKGITQLKDLEQKQKGIYLWQGDITTLGCDSIVNAANCGMTGCYVANHRCIDNAIHSFAGVQLRIECDQIMKEQGFKEPTGRAKITCAYNLPCRYILHTVGPIVSGILTKNDCDLLGSCYHSCLEQAAEEELESVAFCCISTGEFCFPKEEAAEIAVASVKQFLEKETSVKEVVFNVFKDADWEIYERLL